MNNPAQRVRIFRPGTVLGAIVVAAFAALQVLPGLAEEAFFPDEMSFLGQAYYWNLYRGVDRVNHPDPWNDVDWLRYPAYDHEPVTKYLVGLGLNLGGHAAPKDLELWRLWLAGQYPRANQPPDGLLWSRLPIAVCGVVACLGMFALGVAVHGRIVGTVAAMLLAANPLFWTLSRRAMRDVPAEMFLLAAVAVACYAWPRLFTPVFSWRRWVAFAIAEGLLGALAFQTRLTGAIALVIVGGILTLAVSSELRQRARKIQDATSRAANLNVIAPLAALLLMAITACGLSWLLNPMLHARLSDEQIAAAVKNGRITEKEAKDVESLARHGFFGRLEFLWEFRRQWTADVLDERTLQGRAFSDWALRGVGERSRAVLWQGFGRYSLFARRRPGWDHEMQGWEAFLPCLIGDDHEHPRPLSPMRIEEMPGMFPTVGALARLGWPCLWPALIWFPLALLGFVWMILDGRRRLREGQAPVSWGAACYFVIAVGSVALYVPLSWDRYFLPVVTAHSLAVPYGVAATIACIGRRLVLQPPQGAGTP